MGRVEENLKNILNDIKNSRFQLEIPKKDLILIISKYSSNPYPYINRLWIDCYIKQTGEGIFQILTLEFKPITIDCRKIKEGYEDG
jgi:hypothetical protein